MEQQEKQLTLILSLPAINLIFKGLRKLTIEEAGQFTTNLEQEVLKQLSPKEDSNEQKLTN